ncbi:MAG TPA: hypothetical protein GX502_07555 [Syntrophaceticus sp.]|nr:hypothetical protein [Syntrophaceticus sp.]
MPRTIGYLCPICKTVNPKEIKYCLNCGHWLLDTIHEAKAVTNFNYKEQKNIHSAVSWKNVLVALVVIIILIAIVIPRYNTMPTLVYPTVIPRSITMPDLAYPTDIPTESKDFTWDYQGKTYHWHVEIPLELLDYDRQIAKDIQRYAEAGEFERQALYMTMPSTNKQYIKAASHYNYIPWVKEDFNYQFVGYIAECLNIQAEHENYDSVQKVEFVQSFVGGAIPYQVTPGVQFPAHTLAETGKCCDKAILTAAILGNMGYRTALILFESQNHMVVGVALNSIPNYAPAIGYDCNGIKYYFLEVTSPGWQLGQPSNGLETVEPDLIIPVD